MIEKIPIEERVAQLAEAKIKEAEARANVTEYRIQEIEQTLQVMLNSRSWRMTAPLRWFNFQLQLLRQHGIRARSIALLKKISRFVFRPVIFFIVTRPNLRFKCIALAQRIGLYDRIRAIYDKTVYRNISKDVANMSHRAQLINIYPTISTVPKKDLVNMPHRAQLIYAVLGRALEKQRKIR